MSQRFAILVSVIFVGIIFLGCGGGGGESNPVGPTMATAFGSISGTVTSSGLPASNVSLYLIKPQKAIDSGIAGLAGSLVAAPVAALRTALLPDASYGNYRTQSDVNGSFSFPNVETGEYTLLARLDANHQSLRTGILVDVSKSVTIQDFQLTPVGSLRGTVAATGLTNLSGTLVYLDGTSYVAVTDSSGNYLMNGVASFTYTLKVQRPGFMTSSGVSVAINPSLIVDVPAITLTPQPHASIGGIVGTATRSPFAAGDFDHAGSLVHLLGTNFITFTDANGSFNFSDIPKATYSLALPSEKYILQSGTTSPNVTVLSDQITVVSPAIILVPRVPITAYAVFTGIATKSIILSGETDYSGVIIQLATSSGTLFAGTLSDGSFAFRNISPGAYQLSVPQGRYKLAGGANVITVSAPGSLSFTLDPLVPPAAVVPVGNFSGVATKSSFLPGDSNHAGVIIQLTDLRGSYFAVTDGVGNYLFNAIPTGTYQLTVPQGNYKLIGGVASITVSVPGSRNLILYPIVSPVIPTPVGNFSGIATKNSFQVGDSDHSGVIIHIADTRGSYFATTDATGNYLFNSVPTGTYQLTVPQGRYGLAGGISSYSIVVPGMKDISLDPFIQQLVSVSGTAVKSSFLPGEADHANVLLQLSNASGSYYASTDAVGSFTFRNVLPGTYQLSSVDGKYRSSAPLNVLAPSTDALFSVDPIAPTRSKFTVAGWATKTAFIDGDTDNGNVVLTLRSATSTFFANTSDVGSFDFPNIPSGTYDLSIPDSRYKMNGPEPVTVTVPGSMVNIFVDPRVQIGSLIGSATKNTFVSGDLDHSGVILQISHGNMTFFATTDATGSYAFETIPAGMYQLTVPRGRYKISGGVSSITVSVPGNQSLTLDPFETLIPTGDLSGIATKSELISGDTDHAELIIHLSNATRSFNTPTDSLGNYAFKSIPSGTYQLDVISNKYKLAASFSVTVPNSGINFTVTPKLSLGSVVGKVRKTANVGVTDSGQVLVRIASGSQQFSQLSAQDGTFFFTEVPYGPNYIIDFLDKDYTTASATPITFALNSHLLDLTEFSLVPAVQAYGTLLATMTMASPYLLTDIPVELYRVGQSWVYQTQHPDATGSLRFTNLPAGSYSVEIDTETGYYLTAAIATASVVPFQTASFSADLALAPLIPVASVAILSAESTPSQITLTWERVTNAVGYDICHQPTVGGAISLNTGTGTSYTITGLSSGTAYDVQIIAFGEQHVPGPGMAASQTVYTKYSDMTPGSFTASGLLGVSDTASNATIISASGTAYILVNKIDGNSIIHSYTTKNAGFGTHVATNSSEMGDNRLFVGNSLFVASSSSVTELDPTSLSAIGDVVDFGDTVTGVVTAPDGKIIVSNHVLGEGDSFKFHVFASDIHETPLTTQASWTYTDGTEEYLVSEDGTRLGICRQSSGFLSDFLTYEFASARFSLVSTFGSSSDNYLNTARIGNDFFLCYTDSDYMRAYGAQKTAGSDYIFGPQYEAGPGTQIVFDKLQRAWVYDRANKQIRRYAKGQFVTSSTFQMEPAASFSGLNSYSLSAFHPVITYDASTDKIVTGFWRTDVSPNEITVLAFDASTEGPPTPFSPLAP
ncbi:MAG: hypothetical protein WA705_14455 [Candidatus Ozemobacteraceae bacterium]